MWGALGFLAAGDFERGYEIIKAINPAIRCGDKDLAERYRIEPYVFSGDVYSNISHTGRGGWSWYTGAASWYYRVVLENLLGFELLVDRFTINPAVCENKNKGCEFENFSLDIKFTAGSYKINVSRADDGDKIFNLDGNPSDNPIIITNGEHIVDIKY